MEEKTTTEVTQEETGAATAALPVKSEETTAEETVETKSESETGAAALPAKDEETQKLASFAKGQGIENVSDLTPREMSLLKSAYDNKAEYERNRQKATELEKTMSTMSDETAQQVADATGQDPEVLKRLQRMEVKDAIRDFWDSNPDARKYQAEMSKIATESGLYGAPEAILKAAYAIAVANNQGVVKSQGKKEALESLAHKQQAAVPMGSATTSSLPKGKAFADLSIQEMEAKLGFVRR